MCGPTLESHRVSHRTLSAVPNTSWRNTLGDTFNFSSFFGYAKLSILGRQFQLLPVVDRRANIFDPMMSSGVNSIYE